MPPWKIHDTVALKLGYSLEASQKVNKIIDGGKIHDIGRKLPKIRIIDKIVYPEVLSQKISNVIWMCSQITTEEEEDLFYLHHALDTFLTWRIASIILTGTDLKEVEEEFLEGVVADLKTFGYNLRRRLIKMGVHRYPILHSLPEKLRNGFSDLIELQEYISWANSSVVDRRVKLREVPAQEVFNDIMKKIGRRAISYRWKIREVYWDFPINCKDAISAADALNYLRGCAAYEANKLSLLRSGLYDYILVHIGLSWPLSLLHEAFVASKGVFWKRMEPRLKREEEGQMLIKAVENILLGFVKGKEEKIDKIPREVIEKYVSEVKLFMKMYPDPWG